MLRRLAYAAAVLAVALTVVSVLDEGESAVGLLAGLVVIAGRPWASAC